MSAEFIEVHPDNPQPRKIKYITEQLKKGKVIIYPTDSVYNFGCSVNNKKGLDKISKLKSVKLKHANFSLVFNSLSDITDYTKQYSRSTFKLLNKYLPGPYTFILPASNHVARIFETKKREVGIRVPDNNICNSLIAELGFPLVTSSVREDDDITEYLTDPSLIYDKHKNDVDIIVSGGIGNLDASTVIECLGAEPIVLREGIGNVDFI